MNKLHLITCTVLLLLFSLTTDAQVGLRQKRDRKTSTLNQSASEYTIGGIKVVGSKYLDEELLISISGLSAGDKLKFPSDPKISKAIQNLWKQNLFANIEINVDHIQGDKLFLEISITERPRLSKYNFKGIKDNDAKELKDKIGLVKSKVVTEATKQNAVEKIRKFYTEKGFSNVQVKVQEKEDTSFVNMVILTFIVHKGQKVKINQINMFGNEHATVMKLKKNMKDSKEMARISLTAADRESIYGINQHQFNNYLKNKGFLSLSKTAQLLDPYIRY
ncbi:MAG TPA: POTRA domain-containing protein, partial [Chitinophagaceae bacterium]|nr:POTRA domain-containing protein [Chitinophagaceae bacterium]